MSYSDTASGVLEGGTLRKLTFFNCFCKSRRFACEWTLRQCYYSIPHFHAQTSISVSSSINIARTNLFALICFWKSVSLSITFTAAMLAAARISQNCCDVPWDPPMDILIKRILSMQCHGLHMRLLLCINGTQETIPIVSSIFISANIDLYRSIPLTTSTSGSLRLRYSMPDRNS